jgi:hypothetical protein
MELEAINPLKNTRFQTDKFYKIVELNPFDPLPSGEFTYINYRYETFFPEGESQLPICQLNAYQSNSMSLAQNIGVDIARARMRETCLQEVSRKLNRLILTLVDKGCNVIYTTVLSKLHTIKQDYFGAIGCKASMTVAIFGEYINNIFIITMKK